MTLFVNLVRNLQRWNVLSCKNDYCISRYPNLLARNRVCNINFRDSSSLTPASGRSKFRSIPVHPSILRYIQEVGVGIPKKTDARHRRKRPWGGSDNIIAERDEAEHFRVKKLTKQRSSLPPPPFYTATTANNAEAGSKIERIPIKILGSVGSKDEEFPRITKGLPEIVSDDWVCRHLFIIHRTKL